MIPCQPESLLSPSQMPEKARAGPPHTPMGFGGLDADAQVPWCDIGGEQESLLQEADAPRIPWCLRHTEDADSNCSQCNNLDMAVEAIIRSGSCEQIPLSVSLRLGEEARPPLEDQTPGSWSGSPAEEEEAAVPSSPPACSLGLSPFAAHPGPMERSMLPALEIDVERSLASDFVDQSVNMEHMLLSFESIPSHSITDAGYGKASAFPVPVQAPQCFENNPLSPTADVRHNYGPAARTPLGVLSDAPSMYENIPAPSKVDAVHDKKCIRKIIA